MHYKPAQSPIELSEMIIENNPHGVYQNLLQMGVIDDGFLVTPKSFMDVYADIPFESREQALEFIGFTFDVLIDNNGKYASQLWLMVRNAGLSLGQIAYNAWEVATPESPQSPIARNTAISNNPFVSNPLYQQFQQIDKFQTALVVFAAIGFLFAVAVLTKGIQKIFQ